MWWWVWVLLVLGALAAVAALAWMLWRAGVRTLREAGRASETFSVVGERAAAAAQGATPPDTSPTIFDDPVDLSARVADVRRRRAERRGRRRARSERTWQEWATGPSAGESWLRRREVSKESRRAPQAPGGGGDHTRLP